MEDIAKNLFLGATYESLEEFLDTLKSELDCLKISDNGDLTYKF